MSRPPNDNIEDSTDPYYKETWTSNGSGKDNDHDKSAVDGNNSLNRWYSYTVDEDGVYTLKPVKHMIATSYDAGYHHQLLQRPSGRHLR